jgi:type I restriction enzyme S subunit
VTRWKTAHLGDVAAVFNGKTPSKAEQRSTGHPVLKIKDVNERGGFRGKFESFVDPALARRFSTKQVRKGDTLILNAAHNADYVASKTYRAEPPTFGALATGEWLIVRADAEVLDSNFAHHWINSAITRRQLRNLVNGIHLYPKDVARLRVPLPSLTEQRRIAEVLDRAESLGTKRRGALATLEGLTESLFLDLFGNPATNPKDWSKVALGDVATFVGGGTPSRARPEYFTGSICWATSKDMRHEFLDDTEEHITRRAIEDSATKLVPAGTILVVVKSKILARHLPVAVARVPTCFGQDLKGITPNERFEVSFVAASLRLGKRWLLERARGINTEGLTLDHLRAFQLLAPPLSIQREFAKLCGSLESLRTAQRASLAEMDSLLAALHNKAFKGEL